MTIAPELLHSTTVIDRYLAQPFIEREWLAKLVEKHLSDPDCRHVLITAQPGMGKSALVAWLTQRHEVTPRYFIRLDSLAPFASGDAIDLLLAIGHQLADKCPELFDRTPTTITVVQEIERIEENARAVGVRLKRLLASPFASQAIHVYQGAGTIGGEMHGVEIDELVTSERLRDPRQLQHVTLLDPARLLMSTRPGAQIVVLIDALDELRYRAPASGQNVVDWLTDCPMLPANVRVVATARPDEEFLGLYVGRQKDHLRQLEIEPTSAEVIGDLDSYAEEIALDPALRSVATSADVDLAAATVLAARRAGGNFLYLVSWHRALQAAAQENRWDDVRAITNLDAMPRSLSELYRMFIRLLHESAKNQTVTPDWSLPDEPVRSAWESVYWPLLGALAVARAPLTLHQLSMLSRLRGMDRELNRALRHMRQLLTQHPTSIAYFHTSMAEFLTGPLARGNPNYYIDPIRENRRVADNIIAQYGSDWARCNDPYALGNVVTHLILSLQQPAESETHARAQALLELLANQAFVDRAAEVLGVERLLHDFTQSQQALGPMSRDLANEVTRTLAAHGILGTAQRKLLSVESLQASLAYRRDLAEFYAELLAIASDETLIRRLAGSDADAALIKADVIDARINQLRRRGLTHEADQLARNTGMERSRTLYEQGYLCYLLGKVDEALERLSQSAIAAEQAGNDVGQWISELVHDQVAFHAERLSADVYRRKLEQAIVFFATADASSSPHLIRWRLNSHSHLFDLACLTEDPPTAEREWELLADNAWIQQVRPEMVTRWESRLFLAQRNYDRAAESYARLLAMLTDLESGPERPEGEARDFLDYGRALHGLGQYDDAREAWLRTLRCPDDNGAWPWKRRARRLLGDGSDT